MAQPLRSVPGVEEVDPRGTILVIEDDSGNRELIKLALDSFDHTL